ncbi:MAG: fatty acyl-AMP ligase, partial [Sphaerospermopsis sp. SIO1G2]|nr:fatty acyl-AMP ligase [Sphaerospermopsis sp. SIO1G2]
CPIYTTQELQSHITAKSQPHQPDSHDLAFLQHSSGTTGLQKGVALTHTAVVQQLQEYGRAIQLTPQDKIISWLPLYHDMGLIAGFLLPLFHGIPLILMSPFAWVRSPVMLLKAISDHQGTLCWLPNFAYNHITRRTRQRDLDGISLTTMRLFINCSEPVHAASHQLFLERFAPLGANETQLGVSYAMAENTFAVSQTPPNQPAHQDTINGRILATEQRAIPVFPDHPHAITHVSCGRPLPQTAVRVTNSHNHPLAERHIGQITIKSPYMLREYHNRPELTPFTSDGWYHTGDMGYIANGEIYIIGRQKDLIINAGKNIYPQDIEAILNNITGIQPGRVVVFGIPDKREGTELLVALAEANTTNQKQDQQHQLTRQMRQTVAQQSMVTLSYAQIVPPRWLLKTSSGKIGRAANRQKWLAEKNQHNPKT